MCVGARRNDVGLSTVTLAMAWDSRTATENFVRRLVPGHDVFETRLEIPSDSKRFVVEIRSASEIPFHLNFRHGWDKVVMNARRAGKWQKQMERPCPVAAGSSFTLALVVSADGVRVRINDKTLWEFQTVVPPNAEFVFPYEEGSVYARPGDRESVVIKAVRSYRSTAQQRVDRGVSAFAVDAPRTVFFTTSFCDMVPLLEGYDVDVAVECDGGCRVKFANAHHADCSITNLDGYALGKRRLVAEWSRREI